MSHLLERTSNPRAVFSVSLGVLLLLALTLTTASGATRQHGMRLRRRFAPADASFTVNSIADVVDARPGDGKCSTTRRNNVCTLRAAIQETNALFAQFGGSYTIVLPAQSSAYTLTITGGNEDNAATGDLDIKSNLTLQGAGAASTIVDGAQIDRVFQVVAGHVKIIGVTIQNGKPAGPGLISGGGILINSGAKLTLKNSKVNNNSADGSGGILNEGTLKLVKTTISANTSYEGCGGIGNPGIATLTASTVDGNTDFDFEGGGLCNAGTMTLTRSTVSNNHQYGSGGGIFNTGALTLTNSTVSDNTTYQNSGAGGYGGGIFNDSGTVNLFNATIAHNRAANNATGGGIYNHGGTVNFRNTIIADNTVSLQVPPFYFYNDCDGILTSQDYNLISDGGRCTVTGTTTHNQIGVVPNLGPLQNNGGPTQTRALIPPSPAIDKANPAGCTDPVGATLTTDQRGFPRPVDGDGKHGARCDIGAYEYQP